MATRAEKTVGEVLDELEQISDEIRVKVHLAGMDAKDAWKKLEPRIDEAKAHANKATDASIHAVEDIVKAFRDFGASL